MRNVRRKPLTLIGAAGLGLCSVCFCLAVVANLVSGPAAPAATGAAASTPTPAVVLSPAAFVEEATDAPAATNTALPALTGAPTIAPTTEPTSAATGTEPSTDTAPAPTLTHTAVPSATNTPPPPTHTRAAPAVPANMQPPPPPPTSTLPPPPTDTQPPAPTQASDFQELVGLTSPVNAGADATMTVRTTPGAACSIAVYYKSGRSEAQGLEPKTAGGDGICSWTWKVGSRTTPGTWRMSWPQWGHVGVSIRGSV